MIIGDDIPEDRTLEIITESIKKIVRDHINALGDYDHDLMYTTLMDLGETFCEAEERGSRIAITVDAREVEKMQDIPSYWKQLFSGKGYRFFDFNTMNIHSLLKYALVDDKGNPVFACMPTESFRPSNTLYGENGFVCFADPEAMVIRVGRIERGEPVGETLDLRIWEVMDIKCIPGD